MLFHKLVKIAIFFIYWLGFAPWLVLVLRKEGVLSHTSLQDIFLQYTTVLFILIIVYVILHHIFEYFYLRHKIKKAVRRVTIRHQLRRLERGEIDLVAAQRISTFTKMKEPPTSKKLASSDTKKDPSKKAENGKDLEKGGQKKNERKKDKKNTVKAPAIMESKDVVVKEIKMEK